MIPYSSTKYNASLVGAGDAYSAGFLYGWANGQSLQHCAKLGTFCATQVIQQLGARIEPDVLAEFQSL